MIRLAATITPLLCCLASGLAAAGEFTLDGKTFQLPHGFVLEKVAGPPLVDRPIVADFDEAGRLYVADSSGSNAPVQQQLANPSHRILRLEDTDGDGVFDRRTVFAEKVMFPEGTLWFEGSLYVSAPPSIWKFTDADGDGVAEKREEWFQGKTLTGCANDLHGPYLGPDGWIYWAKGAFAQQTYDRPGKPPLVTKASHIFRARPDGTGIEPVMTGGMDNPVDVVFTPGGERIFTTTFLVHPGGGQRDGLIHAVYGGVYGKVHAVLDGHVRTGPEVMPVLDHLGPAAPCGLTRQEADAFGPEYRDNLFTTCFNLQKVTRHALTPTGASFTSKTEDFLVSLDRDFHPTDVLDDADGSLLVVDTGGWYKLCCPTSQLEKPDVLGAIYRVRRQDAPKVADPRGLLLSWDTATPEDLASRLDDPRPVVRRRAIAALGKAGGKALGAINGALQADRSVEARRNAVWSACRNDHRNAQKAIQKALGDLDETVRQTAIHATSVRRDPEALPGLVSLLLGPSSQNRRAAAEALGRIGDPSAVPALLTAAGQVDPADRALEHSIRYALIEIGDPTATALSLLSNRPGTRLAAMVALDQMEGANLSPEQVTPGLDSEDPATRAIASWVVGRHPQWGNALAGYLAKRFDANLNEAEAAALVDQLGRFAGATEVQELVADRLRTGTPEARRRALRAVASTTVKEVPGTWTEGLVAALESEDATLVQEAVKAARGASSAFPKAVQGPLSKSLLAIGDNPRFSDALRLDALAALPGPIDPLSSELFTYLIDKLGPERPVSWRGAAATVLGKAMLSQEQLEALIGTMKLVGPMEIDRLLGAFERSTDAGLGLKLIAALRDAPAASALRVDMLKPRLDKYPPVVREEAESLYASLNVDAAKQRARLEAILPTLANGDIRRGQAIFNAPKSACVSCHAIGYLGGKVGPDLTKIGQVRNDRDLLESIVYPSLSLVRSYEPVTLATLDGRVLNGLLKKDGPDEVILTLSATEEARVPRDQIEEIRPSGISVMPAGLDQQISPQELADLLAFLKSRK